MRFALFADLHANLAAFEACLTDAGQRGYDQIVLLGDLVGYGPSPVEIVRLSQRLKDKGAIVLKGNHDEVAPASQSNLNTLNAQAIAADWTYHQLSQAERDWLWQLPLYHPSGDLVFVHSTMDQPQAWRYANDHKQVALSLNAAEEVCQAKFVICGHVHQQTLFYQGTGREFMPFVPAPGVPIRVTPNRRWLATVGSVGQPRDADPRANYAIVDDQRRQIEFHRVSYDISRTTDEIRRKGLPPELATRLEIGQ